MIPTPCRSSCASRSGSAFPLVAAMAFPISARSTVVFPFAVALHHIGVLRKRLAYDRVQQDRIVRHGKQRMRLRIVLGIAIRSNSTARIFLPVELFTRPSTSRSLSLARLSGEMGSDARAFRRGCCRSFPLRPRARTRMANTSPCRRLATLTADLACAAASSK